MRRIALVPAALAVVAEASWIAVVAGMLQAFTGHDPSPGVAGLGGAALVVAGLVVVVVIGALSAGRLSAGLGSRWPGTALGLAIAAGMAGWLASPDVRAILVERGSTGLGAALAANPGGWLAAAAFVRGIAYDRLPTDPGSLGRLLGIGIPGLTLSVLVGGMAGDPGRARFLADAAAEVVAFLMAGSLGLALARLTMVSSDADLDWRHNPAWIGLLVALVVATAGAAVSVSLFAGPAIVAVLGAAIAPLLLIGLVAGFDRRAARIIGACLVLALMVAAILRAMGAKPTATPGPLPAPGNGAQPPDPVTGSAVLVVGFGLALAVALLAVVILVRLWMRRPKVEIEDDAEVRTIDRGESSEWAPTQRRARSFLRRRPAPTDAVAAYRELLHDLEPRPVVRRGATETPSEHAGRLRRAGLGVLSLDLLAADYGLVRFGGVSLTAAEDRRAVARARALARSLRLSTTRAAALPDADKGDAGPTRDGAGGDSEAGAPGARAGYRPG